MDEIVQTPEQVLPKVEPVSTTPAASTGEATPPLTKDEVKALIAEATQKAIEEGKNLGKREMQAIKDREVADIKRKADLAEKRARVLDESFTDLDEDARARVEQRKTKSELDYYKTREQEEETRKTQDTYYEKLNQSLRDEVSGYGLDPNDKRIDYAKDAKDYFDGRKRFNDSVSKVLKVERENMEKTILQKAEEKNKQFETELRKKYGLDSHDTTTPAGVVNQSDADFMKGWASYDVPDTKENRSRYAQITSKY